MSLLTRSPRASTTAAGGAAGVPARPGAPARDGVRPWALLLFACVGLAALSLLGPAEPTYDPWAWIIWGREITELDLVTTSGPSWKPLPVLFTVGFATFGDDAAPLLWLVVARAGGLLAIAMAYRLAARLAGVPAGLIAAVSLLMADEFVRSFSRGNSEGLLVALCLWAGERHLDGRRTDAFLLGFGAALLRPEVWPFFGLYGLWLAWTEPRRRPLVAACFVLNGLLWFVPEWLGSGDPLRAANRARHPNADSAAFADHPFLEVFERSSSILSVPVLVGAAVAAVLAARRRRWDMRLALGVVAAILMIGVGLMTEGGFAGNLRYVALPAALVCVLAGVGWVELVRAARERFGRVPAGALAAVLAAGAAPFALADAGELRTGVRLLRSEADFAHQLSVAIDRAGGVDEVTSCGQVMTGPFQVPIVAWHLHLHGEQVKITAKPPGVVVAPRLSGMSRDARFTKVAETTKWIVRRACTR